jgi:hypothetical protein
MCGYYAELKDLYKLSKESRKLMKKELAEREKRLKAELDGVQKGLKALRRKELSKSETAANVLQLRKAE